MVISELSNLKFVPHCKVAMCKIPAINLIFRENIFANKQKIKTEKMYSIPKLIVCTNSLIMVKTGPFYTDAVK